MNKTIENIANTFRLIIGLVVIVGFIAICVLGVRQCDANVQNYRQSLPTYRVAYGSFFNGRSSTDFETYKVENNHYTFFDANGKLVGDFTVSGNNKIFITRNIK